MLNKEILFEVMVSKVKVLYLKSNKYQTFGNFGKINVKPLKNCIF